MSSQVGIMLHEIYSENSLYFVDFAPKKKPWLRDIVRRSENACKHVPRKKSGTKGDLLLSSAKAEKSVLTRVGHFRCSQALYDQNLPLPLIGRIRISWLYR